MELIQGTKGMELVHEKGNWVLLREIGFSPVETLVATIGACGAYVYQSVLDNSKVPYTFHKVTLDYTRDTEKQAEPLKEVTIDFYLEVPSELQEKAERALKLVNKNCPVIQSLSDTVVVHEIVHFS